MSSREANGFFYPTFKFSLDCKVNKQYRVGERVNVVGSHTVKLKFNEVKALLTSSDTSGIDFRRGLMSGMLSMLL